MSHHDEKQKRHFADKVIPALLTAAAKGNDNAAAVITYGLLDLSVQKKCDPLQAMYEPHKVLRDLFAKFVEESKREKYLTDCPPGNVVFRSPATFKSIVWRYSRENECGCGRHSDYDFDCEDKYRESCCEPALLLWEQFARLVTVDLQAGVSNKNGELNILQKYTRNIHNILKNPERISKIKWLIAKDPSKPTIDLHTKMQAIFRAIEEIADQGQATTTRDVYLLTPTTFDEIKTSLDPATNRIMNHLSTTTANQLGKQHECLQRSFDMAGKWALPERLVFQRSLYLIFPAILGEIKALGGVG
jgi:hypothetical protein